MRKEKKFPSVREINPSPILFIGGAEVPSQGKPNTKKILEKINQGVNFFQTQYVFDAKLLSDYMKILEDAGISKQYADTYIAGVKALGQQIGNQVKDSVGGADHYQNMVEWAQSNYTPEQIQAYDNAVNSGDVQLAMLTAKGLQADYQNSSGYEGQTVSGDTSLRMSDSSEVFRSNAEVTAAMKDPRYESDMAYRQDVRDKLERSEVFSLGQT